MNHDTQQVSRVGSGILGVLALALVGGTAGTLAYSALGDDDSDHIDLPVRPEISLPGVGPDNTVDIDVDDPVEEPSSDGPADDTVDGPNRIPANGDSVTSEPDDPPAPSRPATNTLKSAAVIVRFNSGDEIDECLRLYKSDKSASREAFAKWASAHPELDGFTLERVNYSGEAILAYSGSDDADPVSNVKQLQARLKAMPQVRYADPDYTAHPGKGD